MVSSAKRTPVFISIAYPTEVNMHIIQNVILLATDIVLSVDERLDPGDVRPYGSYVVSLACPSSQDLDPM